MKRIILLSIAACILFGFADAQTISQVYPKQGYVTADTSLRFEWNDFPGALSYHLQISSDSLFGTVAIDSPNYAPSFYDAALLGGQTVYWRVRANLGASQSAWSATYRTILFKPQMYSGLGLWFNPNGIQLHPSSGKVNLWLDASGHNRNAIQNDTALMPEKNPSTLNNQSAVLFDGNNDYLRIDSPVVYRHLFSISNWTGPTSLFPNSNGLVSRNSGSYPNYILVGRPGYSDWITFTTQSLFETNIRRNGAATYSYAPLQSWKSISGTSSIAHSINQTLLGSYRLLASRYWQGHLAELLVYSDPLTNVQRDVVEAYLRYKYAGPPVNLGRDKVIDYGFCNNSLDAGPGYLSYQWSTGDTTRYAQITSSGIYWVQVTDIFGYSSRDSVNVSFSLPVLNIADTTICLGDTSGITLPFSSSGYSFLWSDNSAAQTLQASVPGQYWVKVTDSLNCFITDTFQILADSFPLLPSLGPDLSLCAGNQIGLLQGGSQVQSYQWSTGAPTPGIIVNISGTYSVTVSNAVGCQAIDSIYVSIKGTAPLMAFLADSACFGAPTLFIDSSTTLAPDTLASWVWNFGDGNADTGSSVQHVFASPGTHMVTLTITTDSGCFNTLQQPVLVYPSPTASFVPFAGCQRTPVLFSDSSVAPLNQIGQWLWNFGDPQSGTNNVSNLQNPSHIYQSDGNFTVSLIIESLAGCRDTGTAQILIKPAPLAAFAYGQSCAGKGTEFTNLSTTLLQNPITLRRWDFGDGSFSNLISPLHVYQTAGTYPISLFLQALNGCTSAAYDSLKVGEIPKAQFVFNDGCAGTPLQLTSTSSIQDGSISHYRWSYQGNIFSTDTMPWFLQNDSGMYQVQLLTISDLGCRDSVLNTVRFHGIPQAGFTLQPEYGIPPHTIILSNKSNGASQYQWDFGDGGSSLLFEPTHTYTDSGTFVVSLRASNFWGCADSSYRKVYVLTSKVDLSIGSISHSFKDGILRCSISVSNLGSRTINGFEAKAWLPDGAPVLETSSDTIEPGQTITYPFKSGFYLGGNEYPSFLCVEAYGINLPADAAPENNLKCLVFSYELKITGLFPNPASNEISLQLIIPEDDRLLVEVVDTYGKTLKAFDEAEVKAGVHTFRFNIDGLSNGAYFLRIGYQDTTISRIFVKRN